MSEPTVTLEEFVKILPSLCAVDTAAANGKDWSPNNPTWGHCAVASLLTQKLFGGELLRISLEGTEFSDSRSHYYNRLPTGALVDATEAQFQGRLQTKTLPAETRTRKYVFENGDTAPRFALLATRFAKRLNAKNPLFDTLTYFICLYHAYLSPCQKADFGALVTHNGLLVAAECNRPIDALCDMCEPECIRFRIASRTESMLGACGHAEEWAMKSAREYGVDLAECDLYVAGTTANGLPWLKESASFSCLRCAVAIFYAGLQKIFVPVQNRWEALTPEECLSISKNYALQKT